MSRTKKIIIGLLSLLTVCVGVGCVFAVQFVNKARATTTDMYESVERTQTSQSSVNFEATEPFSVLLLGIDSGGLGREDRGRSDTMMVVTVNPKQHKSTIVSLDRDIYTNIVGHNTVDKLNHAYAFGGVGMAMDSVEALLDIPINHYVTINLDGFSELVDSVGGIDVTNKYHFELDGVELLPGDYHLDGKQALSYARYRKYNATTKMGDPDGDIGRQARQREVVEKIAKQILSFDSVTKYQDILTAVGNNVKTDLVWNDMLKIIQGYTGAAKEIEPLQLQGEGVMINKIYYQQVHQENLLEIQNKLKTQMNLPTNKELDVTKYASGLFFGSSTAGSGETETTVESATDADASAAADTYYDDDATTNDNSGSTSNGSTSNGGGSSTNTGGGGSNSGNTGNGSTGNGGGSTGGGSSSESTPPVESSTPPDSSSSSESSSSEPPVTEPSTPETPVEGATTPSTSTP